MIDTKTWRPVVPQSRGEPMLRPKGTPTPCWQCPKIPKGASPKPESAIVLSAKNQRALWYYWLCRSDRSNIIPEDEIVVQNNAVIQMVIDGHDRSERQVTQKLLALQKV